VSSLYAYFASILVYKQVPGDYDQSLLQVFNMEG